jgi:SAM-dependent methyltransferase
MTYDWHGTISSTPLTEPWFAEMDDRWIAASFPYVSRSLPFDKIMPADLTGMSVLEIGCGMGLHTEQLARRGADITAIDLTAPAVEATSTRLRLRGLHGVVQQGDAEDLPFGPETFDLVWSWGAIHHSSRTARIVREIARVLKPQGETRIMVYNRNARIARLALLRHYLLGGEFRTKSTDEALWAHTDGFMARHYTVDGLDDMLRGFFSHSSTVILGQEVDVVPLPSRFRKVVMPFVSVPRREAIAAKHGWFLFATAREPIRTT